MEKRLTSKINDYFTIFKQDIKKKLDELDIYNNNLKNEILQFVYDYDNLALNKDDFSKRKRVKSFVPFYLRCHAKRANGEQCTRKKKDDSSYCGTHYKNRPHGIIQQSENEKKLKKMTVWIQDINGIYYYIDDNFNVYKTEDIISNNIDPKVFAKYKIENNQYLLIDY